MSRSANNETTGYHESSYETRLMYELTHELYYGQLKELIGSIGVDPRNVLDIADPKGTLERAAYFLKPSSTKPRWILEQGGYVANIEKESEPFIFNLADRFGMRVPLGKEVPAPIKQPLIIVESGANKTSVNRRAVGESFLNVCSAADHSTERLMIQFGSNRLIGPYRKDRNNSIVANNEYSIVSSICGGLNGQPLTEYAVNCASALEEGYDVVDDVGSSFGGIHFYHPEKKITLFVMAAQTFRDGIARLVDDGYTNNRNLVVCTNGQYRPKDELQAWKVVRQKNAPVSSIRAIGDETGARNAKTYVGELASLMREIVRNRIS